MAEPEGEQVESRWRLPFEVVLHRILADYRGEDAKVASGMEAGMRKLFERPYVDEFAEILRTNAKDLQECQRIIFLPRLSDMSHYVTILSHLTPEATARKKQLLKFKVLSVLYSLHRKDGVLMDNFIHTGGLRALTRLLAEDHNVIQSEAVELLMQLLDPLLKQQTATTWRQKLFLHEVFECFCAGEFWLNLAKILAAPSEVFPKSHENTLWLVSCAVGWLRPPEAFALPTVPPPPESAEMKIALSTFLKGAVGAHPQHRQIAQDLLEDLQEGLAVRPDPMSKEELATARKALADSSAAEDASHAWQSLKRLGNDGVAANLLKPAEAAYALAIEEGGDYIPDAEASKIESNRALVWIKLKNYEQAAMASAYAIDLDSQNSKAAYRRAQSLLAMPRSDSAQDAREALKAAELAATLLPSDPKVVEMLAQAKEWCSTFQAEEPAAPKAAGSLLEMD